MDSTPRYGRRSDPTAAPQCPRHPHEKSVSYCKRCNRPTCMTCTLPTDVGTICVECSSNTITRLARPTLGTPITVGLIAINLAIFALGFFTNEIYKWLAFHPVVAYYQPWRILTTAFLHAGLAHVAFNMLSLYWTGQALEPLMGRARFLAVYLLSALGGTTAVLAWILADPDTVNVVTVGASGAVFGLFGAVFVLQKATGTDTAPILGLLALNFVYGLLLPNVSWQGHLGGLVVGVAATYIMVKMDKPRPGLKARTQNIRTGLALAGLFTALVAAQFAIYSILAGQ